MDSFEKRWSFGYYFMKKYLIIFDQNRKLIIFYNKIKENNIQISIIISIIFGIIIIGLVIYIYNNLKKKRKIRANELEENFEYIQQN
jgi:cbb3-type cytochrome oxidase subunit 3